MDLLSEINLSKETFEQDITLLKKKMNILLENERLIFDFERDILNCLSARFPYSEMDIEITIENNHDCSWSDEQALDEDHIVLFIDAYNFDEEVDEFEDYIKRHFDECFTQATNMKFVVHTD